MHALRLLDSQFMKILIPSLQAGRQAAAAAALPHLRTKGGQKKRGGLRTSLLAQLFS
jgi:hypothetical protein